MTYLFDLLVYSRQTAMEHPILAVIAVCIFALFVLPPVALAAFLGAPVLIPVGFLLLVRQAVRHLCSIPTQASVQGSCDNIRCDVTPSQARRWLRSRSDSQDSRAETSIANVAEPEAIGQHDCLLLRESVSCVQQPHATLCSAVFC